MKTKPTTQKPGFALVVTLTLMVLLSILALGMLSLSTVALRSMNASSPAETARANARMAVMMALGELQRTAGDDRRITADGSILDDPINPDKGAIRHPKAVGVWKSWSPDLARNPTEGAPGYTTPKTATAAGPAPLNPGFLTWLVSSPNPADLQNPNWAKTPLDPTDPTDPNLIDLFVQSSDGFKLQALKVDLKQGAVVTGSFAWAVSQEATRAKINVGGEPNALDANDALQAQYRPNLSFSQRFKQPTSGWNSRFARVISFSQADLDTNLKAGADPASTARADFTVHSMGLLTDVVKGGLKVDMSLGFEMTDGSFNAASWGSIQNPFLAASAPEVSGGVNYKGQRPLFKPLSVSASHPAQLTFFDPNDPSDQPAKVQFNFPVAGVPTFHSLRSFYRTHHYLYKTGDGLTLFERPADHSAITLLNRMALF